MSHVPSIAVIPGSTKTQKSECLLILKDLVLFLFVSWHFCINCHISSSSNVITKNNSDCFGVESTLILKYRFLSFALCNLVYFLFLYLRLRKSIYWLEEVIRSPRGCHRDTKDLFSVICCDNNNLYIEVTYAL